MFRQVPACYSAWGCVAVWASVPAVLTKSCFGCPLQGDIRWQGDIYICTYKCLGGFQEEEQPLTSNSPKGTTFPQASQPRATPFLTVDVVSSVSLDTSAGTWLSLQSLLTHMGSTGLYLFMLRLLLLCTSQEQCLLLLNTGSFPNCFTAHSCPREVTGVS